MAEYEEGQAPPNFSEAVVTRQQGRSVTKIGQNPNIRPMIHNDAGISQPQPQNNSNNSGNNNSNNGSNNVVFYGQSQRRQTQSGGAAIDKSQINAAGKSPDSNAIGVALQVQTGSKINNNNNNSNSIGYGEECLSNPRQLGALALLGVLCFVVAFYSLGNKNISAFVGWIFIFFGFICWICVGWGLAKLQNTEDETPTWLIICCPCICVLCFLCGAAGDGNTTHMFEPRRKNRNKHQPGQVIVSAV